MDPALKPRRIAAAISGYVFALLANLAALGLTAGLEPILTPSPFPIFVAATALSAWFYGVGVGVFSALLATLVTNYFFMPPRYLLTLGNEDVSRLGVFMLVTAIAISLMRAQKLAAEARAHLGAIVSFSDDGIIGVSPQGLITGWNTGAERIYGYPAREMIGQPILGIVPAEKQPEMQAVLERARGGTPTEQLETVHRQRSGQHIDVAVTISPIRNAAGQTTGASLIARNITDRRRAEKALQEYTERLHRLSQRLVQVQEDERRFIAREMHDEIGQILTGLQLTLEVIPQLPPDVLQEKARQAQGQVNELIERVSRLTLDLRPPMLDDLGLLPTLLWHFNRYTQLTGIPVGFRHNGLEKRRFDPEVETAAYRIVQEALTNAARHASASCVEVRVAVEPAWLRIRIADDGQGFDPQSVLSGGKASGLVGMRERAELLDGTLAFDSTPGGGTRLEVALPLPAALEKLP